MIDNTARNAEIVRLSKSGIGPRDIARQLKMSPNIVAGVLHRAKLTSEPRGRGYGASPEIKQKAINAYFSPNGTAHAVASRFGVSAATIYRWATEVPA